MDIINTIILLLSGQGIVLACFIYLKDKSARNKWITNYILTFSGILIYWYFTYWDVNPIAQLEVFRADLFLHLFLGPMLIMALNPTQSWKKHLVPQIIFGALLWAYFIYLNHGLVESKSWDQPGFTYQVNIYVRILSLIPSFWYIYQARPYFNSTPNKLLISSLGAYLLGWISVHVMTYTTGFVAAIDYTLVFIEILLFYGTGYFILIGGKKPQYKVDSSELNYLTNRITEFMSERKPFLDPDFSLTTMSKSLDIHSKKLSQVINHGFGQGFSEYINSYRIAEAKELLVSESYQKHTVLEILMECGFNSKSAFNSAFKKHTGLSPLQYKKASIQ